MMDTRGPDDALKDAFRSTMANVCSPVAVVTALDGTRAHGTTVSAFISLSMEPPMVAVALDGSSELLGFVRRARRFGLNVLSCDQASLARRFASKGRDKAEGTVWSIDHGSPRIAGVSGWLACGVSDVVAGGDHWIVLGSVVAAEAGDAAPMTYHASTFGRHSQVGS
jgi:flavin reductase (DIM6/NTAB) family NADH-FMN oxidoreductase RutF